MPNALPPHDIAAEQAVLGSALLDEGVMPALAESLKPDHFFRERHRWVYDACLAVYGRHEAVNEITVNYELANQGRLEKLGIAFCTDLVMSTPSSAFAEHYATIVRNTAMRRRIIELSGQLAALATTGNDDPITVLDTADALLAEVRNDQPSTAGRTLSELIDTLLAALGQHETGALPLGLDRLDRLLNGGLYPGNLAIIAARPGMGKTSLAMNMAEFVAHQGKRVGVFSMEMSGDELTARLITSITGIPTPLLRSPHLSDAQMDQLIEVTAVVSDLLLIIDDSALLTPLEIRSRTHSMARSGGVNLIVVDYLQLMHVAGSKAGRVEQITEISRALKGLAKELQIPVIALAQLNREVERRDNHKPQLSDLRDSGAIEQDADVVMFLTREDAYYTREEWERKYSEKPYPEGKALLHLAKHRNGATGEVQLYFDPKRTRFFDMGLSG